MRTAPFSIRATAFTVGHAQLHIASSNVQLANFTTLQREHAGVAGLIQLTADAGLDVREVNKQSEVNITNVNADLSARGTTGAEPERRRPYSDGANRKRQR